MSKIDELIKKLCPSGVEYKELRQVCDVIRGDRITKKDLIDDGKYPVMSGGVTFFGRYSKANRKANTITVAQYGSAGYVSFIKEDFWANDVCYSVIPYDFIDNKFLYYVLCHNQKHLYIFFCLFQSSHETMVSCEKALLLPYWVLANSSPAQNIGTPLESIRSVMAFFI